MFRILVGAVLYTVFVFFDGFCHCGFTTVILLVYWYILPVEELEHCYSWSWKCSQRSSHYLEVAKTVNTTFSSRNVSCWSCCCGGIDECDHRNRFSRSFLLPKHEHEFKLKSGTQYLKVRLSLWRGSSPTTLQSTQSCTWTPPTFQVKNKMFSVVFLFSVVF